MASSQRWDPGWYPNPDDQRELRYWDGAAWGEDTRQRDAEKRWWRPGWYPDPGNTKQQRRWDGAAWTDQTRKLGFFDRAAGAGAVERPGGDHDDLVNPSRLGIGLSLAGAVALVLGVFLPYVSNPDAFSSIQANSLLQSDRTRALVVLAMAGLIAWSAYRSFRDRRRLITPAVAGIVAMAIAVSTVASEDGLTIYPLNEEGEPRTSTPGVEGNPGSGLYVIGVGAALAIVGGLFMGLAPSLRQKQHEPPRAPQEPVKRCPDCAEAVRRDARICRFCGYRFEPGDG